MCNQEKYPLRRGVVVVNDRKISYNTFKKKRPRSFHCYCTNIFMHYKCSIKKSAYNVE